MQLIRTLVILASIFVGTNALAQPKNVVTSPAGTGFNFTQGADSGFSVRVPLAYAEPAAAAATGIELVGQADVVFRDGRGGDLGSLFVVTVVGEPTVAPALLIKAAASLQPGTYTLVLLLRQKGDSKAVPQSLALALQRPAAVLTAERTLVVGQEQLWCKDDVSLSGSLKLTETSTKSNAAALTFSDTHEVRDGQLPDKAKLVVTGSASVPSGQSVLLSVAPKGTFPLGKTSGKLEVSTPDMASPLLVNYEVLARRPTWIIAVVAALGALLGFLLRVVLTRRQNMIGARISVNLAIAELQKQRELTDDMPFLFKLRTLENELQTAVMLRDAKRVEELIRALPGSIDQATAAVDGALATVAVDYVAMNKLLSPSWSMPTRFHTSFVGVVEALHDVKALLDRRNPSIARLHLDTATIMLADGAHDLQSYSRRVMTALEWLTTHLPPLNSEDAKRAQDAIKLVQVELGKVDEVKRQVSSAYADSVLSCMDPAYEHLLVVLQSLEGQTANFAVWVATTLGISSVDIFEAGKPGVASRDYVSRLVQVLDSGEDGPTALGAAWTTLVDKWRAMLKASRAGVDEKALTAKLVSGDWQGAVELAVASVASTVLGNGGAGLTSGAANFVDASRAVMTGSAKQGFRLPLDGIRVNGTLSELDALENANWWLVVLQSLFFYGLFVAIAYATYEQAWIGDFKEIVALFLFAFSVDLTADSVIVAFKKPKAAA